MSSYTVGKRTVYYVGEKREEFPVTTLADGEYQKFNDLKASCKADGTKFCDPEFDPDANDLIGEIELLTIPYPNWDRQFQWKRPQEVNPNAVFCAVNPTTGKRSYDRDDVQQGAMGDCYYLTSAGLITSNPKLLEFVIPSDNTVDEQWGIYHFRFWVRGYYFDVVVDDRLPFVDLFGDGKLITAMTKFGVNETWPALVEKAYAKLYGSYASIEGGYQAFALEDFTGGVGETKLTKDEPIVFEKLDPMLQFGIFVGLGTPNPARADYGLVDGHAYAVVGKATVVNNQGVTVKLLRVRNPHGLGGKEWLGDWSDKSTLWSTVSTTDKNRLLIDKNEGEFWIPVEQASNPTFFRDVFYTYWVNDLDNNFDPATQGWHWKEFHGSWSGAAVGTSTAWEAVAARPQYVVTIDNQNIGTAGGKAYLIVALLNKAYLRTKREDYPAIDFRVYKIYEPSLVGKSPPFVADNFIYGEIRSIDFHQSTFLNYREKSGGQALEAGTYVIIPNCVVEGDYLLRIISEGKASA